MLTVNTLLKDTSPELLSKIQEGNIDLCIFKFHDADQGTVFEKVLEIVSDYQRFKKLVTC